MFASHFGQSNATMTCHCFALLYLAAYVRAAVAFCLAVCYLSQGVLYGPKPHRSAIRSLNLCWFSTKYHVNKVRARQWADAAHVPLHYAVARDTASSTVLQEKPDVEQSKIQWLQRHDQECGGLYGLLPICLSLPVRATEHLDRSRGILKGCKKERL